MAATDSKLIIPRFKSTKPRLQNTCTGAKLTSINSAPCWLDPHFAALHEWVEFNSGAGCPVIVIGTFQMLIHMCACICASLCTGLCRYPASQCPERAGSCWIQNHLGDLRHLYAYKLSPHCMGSLARSRTHPLTCICVHGISRCTSLQLTTLCCIELLCDALCFMALGYNMLASRPSIAVALIGRRGSFGCKVCCARILW